MKVYLWSAAHERGRGRPSCSGPQQVQHGRELGLARLDFLKRETGELVRENDPLVGRVQEIVRNERGLVVAGLVPGSRYLHVLRHVEPHLLRQFAQQRLDAVSGIEHVVDDQQRIPGIRLLDDVVQTVHADRLRALADADIGGCAYRDVVGTYADVLEVFLDRDSDRCAPAPDADYEIRAETAPVDLCAETEGVLQQ